MTYEMGKADQSTAGRKERRKEGFEINEERLAFLFKKLVKEGRIDELRMMFNDKQVREKLYEECEMIMPKQ